MTITPVAHLGTQAFVQEANVVAYCSKIPGQMHAYGNDAYTAILLGMKKIVC